MAVVVDANVALRWLFDMDGTTQADALLRGNEPLIAPDLIFSEVTNAVWKMVTFASLSPAAATESILKLGDFFSEIVSSRDLKDAALAISLALRHPAYDCFYLALAEQRDCEVVSSDDRLLARCAGTPYAKRIKPLVSAPSSRRR
jgi:predicted nucleic acid-binding protein